MTKRIFPQPKVYMNTGDTEGYQGNSPGDESRIELSQRAKTILKKCSTSKDSLARPHIYDRA